MSFKPLKRNGLFADQVGPAYKGSRVCHTARWGAELKHTRPWMGRRGCRRRPRSLPATESSRRKREPLLMLPNEGSRFRGNGLVVVEYALRDLSRGGTAGAATGPHRRGGRWR